MKDFNYSWKELPSTLQTPLWAFLSEQTSILLEMTMANLTSVDEWWNTAADATKRAEQINAFANSNPEYRGILHSFLQTKGENLSDYGISWAKYSEAALPHRAPRLFQIVRDATEPRIEAKEKTLLDLIPKEAQWDGSSKKLGTLARNIRKVCPIVKPLFCLELVIRNYEHSHKKGKRIFQEWMRKKDANEILALHQVIDLLTDEEKKVFLHDALQCADAFKNAVIGMDDGERKSFCKKYGIEDKEDSFIKFDAFFMTTFLNEKTLDTLSQKFKELLTEAARETSIPPRISHLLETPTITLANSPEFSGLLDELATDDKKRLISLVIDDTDTPVHSAKVVVTPLSHS